MNCSRCGADKPPKEFYRCATLKRGRALWCKSCTTAYRDTDAFRTYVREYARKRRAKAENENPPPSDCAAGL
jgi:hypothetical protein